MPKPVIVLEFNGLTASLLSAFMERGILPNFRKLRDSSQVFVTDAEGSAPNPEPWIQWATAHTGLSFTGRGIRNGGDGYELDAPRLWDILSEYGHNVWICGSMDAAVHRPVRGFILPDSRSGGAALHPPGEFDTFFKYFRKMVQQQSGRSTVPGFQIRVTFLKWLLSHGLSSATVRQTISQLWEERRTGTGHGKRMALLDRIRWDVFSWYWKHHRPDSSTFFLDGTAHFRQMYPENQPGSGGDTEFGYRFMDKIIGECLSLAGSETSVILCSAVGRQPCLNDGEAARPFYRIVSPPDFFRFAGVTGSYEYLPVRPEQFRVHLDSAEDAETVACLLAALRFASGEPVLKVQTVRSEVFASFIVSSAADMSMPVLNACCSSQPFRRLVCQSTSVEDGMYHPEGMLWIRRPGAAPGVSEAPMPLRSFAPFVLELFNISAPVSLSADPPDTRKAAMAAHSGRS